jgi:hypothetical protein
VEEIAREIRERDAKEERGWGQGFSTEGTEKHGREENEDRSTEIEVWLCN